MTTPRENWSADWIGENQLRIIANNYLLPEDNDFSSNLFSGSTPIGSESMITPSPFVNISIVKEDQLLEDTKVIFLSFIDNQLDKSII